MIMFDLLCCAVRCVTACNSKDCSRRAQAAAATPLLAALNARIMCHSCICSYLSAGVAALVARQQAACQGFLGTWPRCNCCFPVAHSASCLHCERVLQRSFITKKVVTRYAIAVQQWPSIHALHVMLAGCWQLTWPLAGSPVALSWPTQLQLCLSPVASIELHIKC